MENPIAVLHYHHTDFLIEWPRESLKSRHAFIDSHKSIEERALRHRLLKPVTGQLPAELRTAQAAWETAKAAWRTAQLTRGKTLDASLTVEVAWRRVYLDNLPAIEALHAAECPDCPWDGKTIFTRKNEQGVWY